jgi:hypothetical protein
MKKKGGSSVPRVPREYGALPSVGGSPRGKAAPARDTPEEPSPRGTEAPRNPRTRGIIAIALFLISIITRLLFWQATPDRHWPWSAYYKGDAPLWLDYARSLQLGVAFELGLPIHPPATAWLVALLWNGEASGVAWLRVAWLLLGALVPPLVFLAVARSFGTRVALFTGGFCAVSTGLLMLSTSIDSETPYLVLVAASLWFGRDLLDAPRLVPLAVWSVLNAAACLVRVDHLLFYLLALAFFTIVSFRRSGTAAVRHVILSLLFFVLPLVPWHLSAWSAVRRFNEVPRQLSAVEEQAISSVEHTLQHVPWTPGARERREALPAFVRRTASAFVLATVYYRGGRQVRAEDFFVLEEAFGYVPRPLQRFPFVSLYGPLNFALANNANATGGFDRSPLDAAPPLAGGAQSYPSFLVQGLPPPQLTFFYPPHLRLFNEGYSVGWRWIATNPADFATLLARKLAIFWSGAAQGVTGYGAPIGISGTRRAVDLVVPDSGPLTLIWRIVLLLAAVAGVAVAWRTPDLWPWLLFLASKIVVSVLFFGYARLGAMVIPVVALLAALAVRPLLARVTIIAFAALILLALAVDAVRVASRPTLAIDDRVAMTSDLDPGDVHRDQRIDVR